MDSDVDAERQGSELDAAWERYRDDLLFCLGGLELDRSVLVDVAEQDRADGAVPYLWAARRAEGLWVEVSSNHYLCPDLALDEAGARRLVELGLHPPDEERPNFWLATHLGGKRRVADLFVAVLREVFGVAHPRILDGDDDRAEAEPVREAAAPVTASEARQSIDDLVSGALDYRSSAAFEELLRFVGGFRLQAPFNALLLHLQRPGTAFVATARRWREDYGRAVLPGERPLVVLQPFGPVMFVYDVSQTEPTADGPALPIMVDTPYAMPPVTGVDDALRLTVENAKLDGVRVTRVAAGSQSAGCIRLAALGMQEVQVRRRPPQFEHIPVRYDVDVNAAFPASEAYATLAHELGHLYCGHLGTPNPKWWADRRGLPEVVREFEAEAVGSIACRRLDPDADLPPHLTQYLGHHPHVPDGISVDRIMTAAGRVVEMGAKRMRRRDPQQ